MPHLVSPIQGDVVFVGIDSLGVAQGWIVGGLSGQTGRRTNGGGWQR